MCAMDANGPPRFRVRRLNPGDDAVFLQMNTLFGEAFDDQESYHRHRPGKAYVNRLLANPGFIALVALEDAAVVGALVAYELVKFEQERSEVYLYDLAVGAPHRRRGVATELITALRAIARELGAWVIFVQADTDEDDEPAIALYGKLGTKEEVLHFDIAVLPREDTTSKPLPS